MSQSLSRTESQDAIDAAIQSAESLFASLLDRTSLSSVSSPTEVDPLSPRHLVLPSPDSSLQTIGAASLGPAQLMAHAQAVGPIMEGIQSPKESLNAIVCRPSVTSMPVPPDYDTLYEMLKEREKDLDVSAKIGETLLRRSELLERDLTSALDMRQGSEQHLAQLRHELGQKDELLKLYARQEKEREFTAAGSEGEDSKPEWVQVLTEECKELRESNMYLRVEADRLRRETAEIELQEKDLVHQCLQQFSEAKQRLSELREETEQKTEENVALQGKLQNLSNQNEDLLNKQQQLLDDNDLLREQLVEAQDAHSQLSHEVSELQDKYGECSVMLKEAQEEIVTLKDASLHTSTVGGSNSESSANVEHESIVQEIEEVLRKEIIAASTLPERPRSPNHYARQRTMVVMETVRAATLATARRLERLKAEAEKQKQATQSDEQGARSDQPSAVPAFSPIAASSPANRLKLAFRNISVGTAGLGLASPSQKPPSPVSSDAGSTISLPEEIMKYRNHPYFAPEKLQIVKPLEGSVTLLKWKLLATPQLGGAKTFFSDASLPGVHKKEGSEKHPETSQFSEASYGDLRQKSKSTFDLSSSPGHSSLRRKHSKREKLIRTKASDLNVTVGSERGMNVMTELLPGSEGVARSPGVQRVKKQSDGERRSNEAAGSSLLRQVGNLLGFSRFSRHPEPEPQEEEDRNVVESTDTGLAGLL